MRAAWLDCFSGISGNMLLAAVLDAGADPRRLRAEVKSVVPDFRLVVKDQARGHLGGKHVRVLYQKRGQPARRLGHIVKMIRSSGLPARVRENSVKVFTALANAEARVHRIAPQEVHFHEVGAVDAIVDVVGSVAGLELLGVRAVACSPLPVNYGEVQCAHGTLPLPAPAVMELLKGVPVRPLALDTELVTPTGAALAVTLSSSFGPMPAMKVEAIGSGLGDREIPGRPNLMRLVIGETMAPAAAVLQIEAAIDDMSPEHYDFLMDRLLEAGALEVLFIPAQMKKNRPGTMVRALAEAEAADRVEAALFNHSTTLGVRRCEVARAVLPRHSVTVPTPFGNLAAKIAERPDGTARVHPEYDQVKRAAEKAGVSLQTVENAVRDALKQRRTGKR
jgi:uncharacterized protein (TIGR00299 family) protein